MTDSVMSAASPALARVMDALLWAGTAHADSGQVRRLGEPYVTHLIEVVGIVASVPHTIDMLVASALHDVIEDTGITANEVRQRYGDDVEELVVWLTNPAHPAHLSRSIRKDLDRQRLARAPAAVQTIKLADGLSNCKNIVAVDPAFAKVYVPEKMRLIRDLDRGDRTLLSRFDDLLSHQWGIIEGLEVERQMSALGCTGSVPAI